ncbi:MAG TPA: sigma-54 dependent transcriptional regulator [Thermoanaerobaculia bacterium]|nr:sigma-54 dependent transcriptional regulator [Thermoanaerobaculia bacterium]
MSPSPKILIADDQRDVREALRLLLKGEGFETATAMSPAEVLEAVSRSDWDAVLMDLNYTRDTTSGREGLDLLSRLRAVDETLPVVVMTAWASVGLAVEAMRHGARDFVEKPWDNTRLLSILRTQVDLGRALRRGERLEAENRLLRDASEGADGAGAGDGLDGRGKLLARSPAMRPVLDLIERVGPSEAHILITGENGTGKGVVARALHAVSARAGKPMITVNTGGLSESVFESELFGHVRGAFTDAKTDRAGRFELADGGILFLDEIANISLAQQTKLLRVLETGEFERVGSSRTRSVDVRVFSATNADLREEVTAGRFRQDLLFRLNTVEIHLPPLRARPEDLPLLAEHFLAQHGRRYRKSLAGFEPAALTALLAHPWPGNVRELDHAVERGVLMARGERVSAPDLGLEPVAGASGGAGGIGGIARLEDLPLEEVERVLIQKALARYEGNVSQAAHALGLSRSALYRRLEKHGL